MNDCACETLQKNKKTLKMDAATEENLISDGSTPSHTKTKSSRGLLSHSLLSQSSPTCPPSYSYVCGSDGQICSKREALPLTKGYLSGFYEGIIGDVSHFSLCWNCCSMFFHSKKVPPLGYNGKVHVVIGGMYSGKTTELQRIGRRMAIAKKTVLYIKLDKDNRYSKTKVVTHDGIMEDAISCASLSETVSLAFHHDIICIDEGQFFPTLVEYCDLMANVGKTVVVAMLSGTCNRRLFPEGNTMGLIAIAQTVTKLTSVCGECGFDGASYSALIRPSRKGEIKEDGVLIGGLDTYEAMCRRCFMKNSMK